MQLYNLTTSQNNILAMAQYYSDTSICNIGGTIEFNIDGLSYDVISKTLQNLIDEMDAFRIRIVKQDEQFMQYFAPYEYITIPYVDMRDKSESDIEAYAQALMATPINLIDSPLFRFEILQKDHSWMILLVTHHMISDAWSINLLNEKIIESCSNIINNQEYSKNSDSYKLHIDSEASYLKSPRYEKDRTYWKNAYQNITEIAKIKPGKEKSQSPRAHRLTEVIDGSFFNRIKQFCTDNRYSPAILFETVVLTYLKKINDKDTLPSVGIATLNRVGNTEKNIFGMFISTLPITVPFSENDILIDICKNLSNTHLKAFLHQHYPYNHILHEIRETHHDIENLFDVMVSYQNATIHSDVKTKTKWYTNGNSEVPLALHIDDRDNAGKYVLNLDYQIEQFCDEEAKLLLKRFLYITEQIIAQPNQTVANIKVIPEEEYQLITQTFNHTEIEYPSNHCVHELFEQMAKKHPNKTAVVFEDVKHSYAEINRIANNIAIELRNIGIGPNDIVPIIASRSYLVIAAQIGVLKSGAAYLPIDPSFPKDRISYMLEDAGCKAALIYNANTPEEIKDILDLAKLTDDDYPNLQNINTPNDLCYVIYTSGSTGKPKGTLLTHRNVVNYCNSNRYNVHGKVIEPDIQRIVSVTTIGFDIYVTESLLALLNGMTIYFANDLETRRQPLLGKLIEKYDVEVIQTTPTKMKMFITNPDHLGYLKHLKKIILGGEPFSESLYHELKAHTSAQIYNIYGPTETTVWSTVNEITTNHISIGTPISNTQIHIISKNNELCPIGVSGELCIAGDGVCRGYLNREDLTSEKFINNPFGDGKLYRTGDLALYRFDGQLECLGRIDSQVKIRGLRIELGEIENNICMFESISLAAVVVTKYEGKEFLSAFYQSSTEIDQPQLKAFLSKSLPNYMIPNFFIRLDSFPMTGSGKIARGVLSKYDISQLIDHDDYQAPVTELQKLLCNEFEKQLKISPVGINLDFFGAGGDSIQAIEMLIHLPEEYHLTAKDIYEHPTVESLANLIETRTEQEYETVSCLAKGEDTQAIICFPFAGSNDATFLELAKEINRQAPAVTTYALRHANWLEINFNKAVEEISQIAEKAESVLLYSHCAGSAMALKIYQNLPDKTKIKRIIIGGNIPPIGIRMYGKHLNPWKLLSNNQMLHFLGSVGLGIQEMSKELKVKLAEQFRMDTDCYFKEMAQIDRNLVVPCTVIVSDTDKFTPHINKVQSRWQPYFKNNIDMIVINNANHYFHMQKPQETAKAILGLE